MRKTLNPSGASERQPPAPTAPSPLRRAYPVDEACALLGGISRVSIYRLIDSGELATVLIAGRRLVPTASIDDLLSAKLAEGKSCAKAAAA